MKIEGEQIKGLLEKINKSLIFKNNEYQIPENLFPILYNKIREKELMHSEAIALILEKAIKNGKSKSLFKGLFELMQISNFQCNFEEINIDTERTITQKRRIDILLTCENVNQRKFAIIIENKLNNAPDQVNQLSDYYRDIKSEGYEILKIVYLPASETKRAKKIGDNEADKLLINLYPGNLIEWLTSFIQNEVKIDDEFKTIIKGYITILKLTDMENKRIEENIELTKILGKEESYILNAFKIQDRWNDIKWHTEMDFWNDLLARIRKQFQDKDGKELEKDKFSIEKLTNAIHRKQRRAVHYGIAFKISEKDDYLICISIERGYENMYYGLTVKTKSEEWCNKSNAVFDDLLNKLKRHGLDKTVKATDPDLWLRSNYFNANINFDFFSNENTLKLINSEFRNNTIDKCIKEIDSFINDIKFLL